MRSPFKFLDAYVLKDKDVFFGREEEVASLYQMVTKNRLILVYGQSGTGKTSLVQCGLANRFDATDWYPLFIKRGENINKILKKAIRKGAKADHLESLSEGIEEIYAIHLRPVYLIIDQLEELFILGTEKERKLFIQSIKEILQAKLPCRVIFILREEYLAQLYEFEKVIPSLLDRRLRVERMSIAKLKEVIHKSCGKFNITLENPEQNTQHIIDSLSAGKSGIHLPYLQVYLDMLWREDYQRTYGKTEFSDEGTSIEYPELTFSTQEIENFGAIEDVLQRFLHQQETEIQLQLSKTHPRLPEQVVRLILDSFVTAEGTKRPIQFALQGNELVIPTDFIQPLQKIENRALKDILKALEQRRLLRSEGQSYELAHDSLAAIIEQERTDEERQLAEIKRRLENSYHEYTISGEYLTHKQIDNYEELIPKLNTRQEILSFFEDSQEFVRKKRRKTRTRRRLTYLGLLLFGVMMAIAAIVSNNFAQMANAERKIADAERTKAEKALEALQTAQEKEKQLRIDGLMEKGRSQMVLGEYLNAGLQFELVLTFDSTHKQADSLQHLALEKATIKNQYEELMTFGRQALDKNDLLQAITYFSQANQLPLEQRLQREAMTGIIETRARMLPVFRSSVEEALIFKEAEYCDLALKDIQKSKALMKYLKQNDIQDKLDDIQAVEESCKGENSN